MSPDYRLRPFNFVAADGSGMMSDKKLQGKATSILNAANNQHLHVQDYDGNPQFEFLMKLFRAGRVFVEKGFTQLRRVLIEQGLGDVENIIYMESPTKDSLGRIYFQRPGKDTGGIFGTYVFVERRRVRERVPIGAGAGSVAGAGHNGIRKLID